MSLEALRDSERALLLGMGGGGDVVGALALTELMRGFDARGRSDHARARVSATRETSEERPDSSWVLGGVAWERSPIDPRPGPRSLREIRGGRPLGSAAVLADGETASADGVLFSESRMAAHTGSPTVLLDITGGPTLIAAGIVEAARELACDLVAFIDVGGDVLAHGDEPGLASPLCDAVMLAAAAELPPEVPAVAAVYGPGCDGELSAAEVLERVGDLGGAGALLGAWALTPAACDLVEAAAEVVPTEASLQAARCARGERGTTYIRSGKRKVELTPLGALTFLFDPSIAVESVAPLAHAVRPATSLDQAHNALVGMGVRTELELERARSPE
jgi:hypothetical protein